MNYHLMLDTWCLILDAWEEEDAGAGEKEALDLRGE